MNKASNSFYLFFLENQSFSARLFRLLGPHLLAELGRLGEERTSSELAVCFKVSCVIWVIYVIDTMALRFFGCWLYVIDFHIFLILCYWFSILLTFPCVLRFPMLLISLFFQTFDVLKRFIHVLFCSKEHGWLICGSCCYKTFVYLSGELIGFCGELIGFCVVLINGKGLETPWISSGYRRKTKVVVVELLEVTSVPIKNWQRNNIDRTQFFTSKDTNVSWLFLLGIACSASSSAASAPECLSPAMKPYLYAVKISSDYVGVRSAC